jgi:hypothetical protein
MIIAQLRLWSNSSATKMERKKAIKKLMWKNLHENVITIILLVETEIYENHSITRATLKT